MNSRPLVAIASCFIIGVALPSVMGEFFYLCLAVLGLALLLIGSGLLGVSKWPVALLCLLALLAGAGERWWVQQQNRTEITDNEAQEQRSAQLQGTIASEVDVDGDRVTLLLLTDKLILEDTPMQLLSETILVRIRLLHADDQRVAAAWGRGDSLLLSGNLERPAEAGNFGAFDYRAYLRKERVHWQLSVKGLDTIEHTRADHTIQLLLRSGIDRFRALTSALMDRLYASDHAGYMKGLVAGIRADLDPEQFDAFARLGLTHILAISGLHVAVVVFLLLRIGVWLRLTKERAMALTIAAMPVYAAITGASPSAVRACLMAMLALWLARRNALKDGLHLLSAAAMLMLVWDPRYIENISFQLSFIVTAGLILFVPMISELLRPLRWSWLRSAVAVTVTAQFVSFPLTAYYFHSFHLLSLPANLLLVPFISLLVLPLGMASVAFGAIWQPLGVIPAKVAEWCNVLTFAIVDWLNLYIGLRTVWPQPSFLWVVASYVLMFMGAALLRRKLAYRKQEDLMLAQQPTAQNQQLLEMPRSRYSRTLTVSVTALAAGWLLWGAQPAFLDRTANVMFLDVGQGDSILIRTGAGKHVLIDAGGTVLFRKAGEEWKDRRDPFEVGRKLLVPLLLQRGVGSLDTLVLTHMDTDHIGGAIAVLKQIPVGQILFNGTLKNTDDTLELLALALQKNIPCYALDTSMQWQIDRTATVEVVHPIAGAATSEVVHSAVDLPGELAPIPTTNRQNEQSLVLLVSLYGRTFLLTGDVHAAEERKIIDERQRQQDHSRTAAVDVLKVAHHGSKTSTSLEWLAYWLPAHAVISSGANNLYGHPHIAVTDRLALFDVVIHRTDQVGEVQFGIRPDQTLRIRMKRTLQAI